MFAGIAVAIVVVAVGVLFVLDSTDDEGFVLGEAFHPFTSDADNGNCATSTVGSGGTPNNCDPINLAFEGLALEGVVAAFREAGWVSVGLGSTQWLHLNDTGGLTAQSAQLFFADSLDARLHVRLWRARAVSGESVVLGAVHHEAGVLSHRIDQDWEDAEGRVRSMLCSGTTLVCETGGALLGQLAIQGNDGRWRGWGNDGRPTLIRAAAGGESIERR